MTTVGTTARRVLRAQPSSLYRFPRVNADPRRRRVAGAVLATAVGGLLFGPTFGTALPVGVVVPVVLTALVVHAGVEVALAWPALRAWRIPVTIVVALIGIVETTMPETTSRGLPTAETAHALGHAITTSWLLTLQTSSPATPEHRLVAFVPLLVLVAGLLAAQLGLRERNPHGLLPVLPGVAVAVLAEAFHHLSVSQAAAAVVALAFAASMVGGPQLAVRPIAVLVVATLIGGVATGWVDPVDRATYSLRDHVAAVAGPPHPVTPLDDLNERLKSPDDKVFSIRPHGDSVGADRWLLAVLDRFDGERWTTDDRLRYLGSGVQPPRTAQFSTSQHSATIQLDEPSTWLPSQHGLERADGVDAVVDESAGTLLSADARTGSEYDLRWSTPEISATDLEHAKLDDGGAVGRAATRLSNLGTVPQSVRDALRDATHNARPSFQTALRIEHYLQQRYRLATGANQTPGSGWLDIARFLTSNDPAAGSGAAGVRGSGTSEQFAAAFAAMARLAGIPARIAVGFRQPTHAEPDGSYIVTNGEAMAWPEVAVLGIGWVPMEPMGLPADDTASTTTPLTKATDQARDHLPSPGAFRVKRDAAGTSLIDSARSWLHVIGILLLVLAMFALVAIPLVKYSRAVLRRRRAGSAAVVSAWRETCDRLLDHGIPLEAGMTVRDIAGSAAGLVDPRARRAIEELVELVDEAMWSGDAARPHSVTAAWHAADAVRGSLARWPVVERVAATMAVRSLRPDRAPLTYSSRP